jgi:hypothetical protein
MQRPTSKPSTSSLLGEFGEDFYEDVHSTRTNLKDRGNRGGLRIIYDHEGRGPDCIVRLYVFPPNLHPHIHSNFAEVIQSH